MRILRTGHARNQLQHIYAGVLESVACSNAVCEMYDWEDMFSSGLLQIISFSQPYRTAH